LITAAAAKPVKPAVINRAERTPPPVGGVVTVLLVTVTVQEAVLAPSSVVTVITAVPGATAVILASVALVEATVATALLLEDQVTFLLVASLGVTVARRKSLLPTFICIVERLSETPVTLTPVTTLTVMVSVKPPFVVVTVITVVPTVTGVTIALLLAATVATVGLLELQVTRWSEALEGTTNACSSIFPPRGTVTSAGVGLAFGSLGAPGSVLLTMTMLTPVTTVCAVVTLAKTSKKIKDSATMKDSLFTIKSSL
jgi:hypothetical protein